eukprot:TRINITY_DN4746_c0_g1_i2.p1 TRINITY_DN4746_c0_g1~~TRINITY_DN4746_c0_g1_i2.p1  ORF type:complete len:443 (+),score=95.26 TRINITY_DN4746_c0_g1_i2:86-1414(+)
MEDHQEELQEPQVEEQAQKEASDVEQTNEAEETPSFEEIPKKEVTIDLPPIGAEVFVGALPRSVTQAEMEEHFSSVGEIYSTRFPTFNDTNESKGFMFVCYKDKETVRKAIDRFNGTEIKGRTIRVVKADSRNRLFIGNLSKNLDLEQAKKELTAALNCHHLLEIFADKTNPEFHRGFCFVELADPKTCEDVRRRLDNLEIAGRMLKVTNAEPKEDNSVGDVMATVKGVYISGLASEQLDEEWLKNTFSPYGEIERVVVPQAKKDFAFVHYVSRSSALAAVEGESGKEHDGGKTLSVVLARPSNPGGGRGGPMRGGFRGGRGGMDRGYGRPAPYGRSDPYARPGPYSGYDRPQYAPRGYGPPSYPYEQSPYDTRSYDRPAPYRPSSYDRPPRSSYDRPSGSSYYASAGQGAPVYDSSHKSYGRSPYESSSYPPHQRQDYHPY